MRRTDAEKELYDIPGAHWSIGRASRSSISTSPVSTLKALWSVHRRRATALHFMGQMFSLTDMAREKSVDFKDWTTVHQ